MSSYWDQLERLLAAEWTAEIPDAIIDKGWAPIENRDALTELLTEHDGEYAEDEHDEWNTYCKCGKWLERDSYEWPDHVSSVLENSGLLVAEEELWKDD